MPACLIQSGVYLVSGLERDVGWGLFYGCWMAALPQAPFISGYQLAAILGDG